MEFFFDVPEHLRRFIDNNDILLIVKNTIREDGKQMKKWRYNSKYYPNAKACFVSSYLSIDEAISQKRCVRCKRYCIQYEGPRDAHCGECNLVFQ